MENTFKEYLESNYTVEDLQTIQEHGFEGGISGLIYYSETTKMYDAYAEELHDVLGQWVDDIGFIPEYITKHIGNLACFKNAVVWSIGEYYAGELLAEAEEEKV